MQACPKCGYERKVGWTGCPKCGIVYEKYQPNRPVKKVATGEDLKITLSFLFIIIGLGVVLIYIIFFTVKVPPKENLHTESGVVSSIRHRKGAAVGKRVKVRLYGREGVLIYIEWYTLSGVSLEIRDLIKVGDKIRILVGRGRDGREYIWQIEKDNRILISYDEIKKVAQKSRRTQISIPVIVLVVLISLYLIYLKYEGKES
jgi:hypothetical protein